MTNTIVILRQKSVICFAVGRQILINRCTAMAKRNASDVIMVWQRKNNEVLHSPSEWNVVQWRLFDMVLISDVIHTITSLSAKIGIKYLDDFLSFLIFVAKMKMTNEFPIIPATRTTDNRMSMGNNALAMSLPYSCIRNVWFSSITTTILSILSYWYTLITMDIIHAQERLVTIYTMINKKILKLFKLPQVYFMTLCWWPFVSKWALMICRFLEFISESISSHGNTTLQTP